MKKPIAIMTACVMILCLFASGYVTAAADSIKTIVLCLHDVNAYVGGEKTTIDDAGTIPFTLDSVTMVPIRFVTEKLGAKVSYTGAELPITVQFGDTILSFMLDSKRVTIEKNGSVSTAEMVTPARIIAGKTYIPLRAISENLGFWVKYIEEDHSIIIANQELTGAVLETQISLGKLLNFTNVRIEKIQMDPSGSMTVEPDHGKINLKTSVTPTNATLAGMIRYESSNPSVAKVSSGGIVQILGAGTAVIKALNNDGKITAELNLTVGNAQQAFDRSALSFLAFFFDKVDPALNEFYASNGSDPKTPDNMDFDVFRKNSFQTDAAKLNAYHKQANALLSENPGTIKGNEKAIELSRSVNTAISNIAMRSRQTTLSEADKNYITNQFNAVASAFAKAQ